MARSASTAERRRAGTIELSADGRADHPLRDELAMRFRIDYKTPRKRSRVVDASRFTQSRAFAPVLELSPGESIGKNGRYGSAGYKLITRLEDA